MIGVQALIEAAQREGYERYVEMDTFNAESAKDIQTLEQQIKTLQAERQRRNAAYADWELANRARIEGLRQSLAAETAEREPDDGDAK